MVLDVVAMCIKSASALILQECTILCPTLHSVLLFNYTPEHLQLGVKSTFYGISQPVTSLCLRLPKMNIYII